MIKVTCLRVIILLLFTVSPLFAQENIQINGIISAQFLEETSVHIINSTQGTGTVNSNSGSFQILVKENDELLFSSIQYKNLTVVITSEIMKSGFLEVVLQEDLNVLDEVNISNVGLTGNLTTDIKQIKIVRNMPLNFSAGDLKNMRFESDINDPQSAPTNIAMGQSANFGGGGVDIIGLILGVIIPESNSAKINVPVYKYKNNSNIIAHLRELFDENFFTETLEVQKEYIDDFIYYANDNGLESILNKPKNQLALIEFLMDQSKNYNRRKLKFN